MKTSSLLAVVVAAIAVQADNTYYNLNCQTSGSSPSATDLNNMGLALQASPQAGTQYCNNTDGTDVYVFSHYNLSTFVSPLKMNTCFWAQGIYEFHFFAPGVLDSFFGLSEQYIHWHLWLWRTWRCDTIVRYNTAALNLCSTNINGVFCIYGSELGKQVQSMAINCRNGANLCGGSISVRGADGALARLDFFHA